MDSTRTATGPPGEREDRFRTLFAAAHPDVLRFAQRRVHPSHAEDVVAEAFLVAWRRFDEAPRRVGDQRAWLFGITRNCLLNARRSEDRRAALAVRLADPGRFAPALAPAVPDVEQVAARVDLARAWHTLDAAHQEVLALTAFEELTSPEAGLVLGISSAAYRLRLMRARRALSAALSAPAAVTTTQETSHEPA